MDTPTFIWFERSVQAAPRRSVRQRVLRALKLYWKYAVVIAAAPGAAWLLLGFLAADALVLGAATSGQSSKMTPVSAIAGFPFQLPRMTGCRLRRSADWMVAKRDAAGVWSILPCENDEQFQAQRVLIYETAPIPDTAVVRIGGAYTSSIGLWSPVVTLERGREVTVDGLDPWLTPQDEASVRAAAVASWRDPKKHAAVYTSPLGPADTAAALAGNRSTAYQVNWLAVANDAAVVTAFALLFLSHPRRARRRRELRELAESPVPLTHCPACRYDLAGLVTDNHGDRTCPECGRVCGAFRQHAGARAGWVSTSQ